MSSNERIKRDGDGGESEKPTSRLFLAVLGLFALQVGAVLRRVGRAHTQRQVRAVRISIHPGRASGAGRWFTRRQLRTAPLATSAKKCLRDLGLL